MVTQLRTQDLRITPQRLALLRILAASEGHPIIEEIFDRMKVDFPAMSLATVKKTMTLQDGLVKTFPLRGIKHSPPYLHDGRQLTLEDTVEFFIQDSGLKAQCPGETRPLAFKRTL